MHKEGKQKWMGGEHQSMGFFLCHKRELELYPVDNKVHLVAFNGSVDMVQSRFR